MVGNHVTNWKTLEEVYIASLCYVHVHETQYIPPLQRLHHFHFNCFFYVQHMLYLNGYSKDHPTIKFFWEVFHEFSEEAKRKFLGKTIVG